MERLGHREGHGVLVATVTVCDHDGQPATLRVRVESFVGSTRTEFDCCSAECAVSCLAERLAEPEVVVEPEVVADQEV